MLYAESSYFDGYHFAHIAAYEDQLRLRRRLAAGRDMRRRNAPSRRFPLRSC